MYAQVQFPQKAALSNPYSYAIDPALAETLKPNDYIVVTSVRSDYSVGILGKIVETVPDPSIVTQRVVQKVDVPQYADPLAKIEMGGY